MTIRLGQIAPDFEQDTANGSIRFHCWLGTSWGLLFSHPRDFAPISAAELVEVARLKPEWDRRDIKPVGLSVDTADSHRAFEQDIALVEGRAFNFPVVADSDRTVADLYGMVHAETDAEATARCVFVVDPHKRVRLILTYPPGVGRNFRDILRVIDALQRADAQTRQQPAQPASGGIT
jgi:alkyl hydroperoxide reductase subunit AhpC